MFHVHQIRVISCETHTPSQDNTELELYGILAKVNLTSNLRGPVVSETYSQLGPGAVRIPRGTGSVHS